MNGLLVDYGGVLTTSVLDSFAAFCAAEQLDGATVRRALLSAARAPDSVFARVEVGAISQDEFDDAVAGLLSEACGTAVQPRGLKQRLFAAVGPDEAMARAVLAARRGGVRTALVSNSWGGDGYPRERFAELFDAVLISGEVGLRKPEPEIYRKAADAIGVGCEGCVFVDDFPVNVEGAEAVGMTGILHRDAPATIARLRDLFGAALAID